MGSKTVVCPFCAEEIEASARKCKHCGEFLPGQSRISVLASLLREAAERFTTGSKKRRERKRLVTQMASQDNEVAVRAVERLRTEGWLADGSLADVDLSGANMEGADMAGANLKAADLRGARLCGANMDGAWLGGISGRGSNLEGADLRSASLQRALLAGANLKDADLRDANLQGAFLFNVNLTGADLRGANLLDAKLEGACLEDANLEGAMLPERRPPAAPDLPVMQELQFHVVPRRRARNVSEGWRVVLVPWEAGQPVVALELWGDAEIGRSFGADIDLLPHRGWDEGVSRRHAQLSASSSTLLLSDLGSTNGTFINAERLEPGQPHALNDSDTVRFGNVSFDLYILHRPMGNH